MAEQQHKLAETTAAARGTPLADRALAEALDAADPLREHRAEFSFPKHTDGTPQRYFAGNSLGLQHKGVEAALQGALLKWREEAVEGWWTGPNPWFELDEALRSDMASLVGAKTEEVILMNTLTVNLHLLMAAFYKPNGQRRKILCEQFPFPSDMHAFVSQAEFHGLTADDVVTIGNNEVPDVVTTETFLDAIETHKDTAAVIVIGAVHFLSGQYFDIATIAAAAKKHGIVVGVDAAHAAGNVPLQLHDWDVDFACWCTYKYLNSGPGNLGGAFVHEKHCVALGPDGKPETNKQLKGWWGHARQNRFSLHKTFDHAPGAAAYQISTVNVLGMTAFTPSLRLAAKIGIANLRLKSLALSGYLDSLLRAELSHALQVITPADPERRGTQISVRILPGALREEHAASSTYACGTDGASPAHTAQRHLLERGIVVDNRPPDVLRLSPVPTYNSYEDVWVLFDALRTLMKPAP